MEESYDALGLALGWTSWTTSRSMPACVRASHCPAERALQRRDRPRRSEAYLKDSYDDIRYLRVRSPRHRRGVVCGPQLPGARDDRSVVDFGAGIKLATPLNPTSSPLSYFMRLRERAMLTPRATSLLENDDGFGVTLAADTEWSVDPWIALRWGNSLTFSEATEASAGAAA